MAPKFEVFETSKEEYPKVHTLWTYKLVKTYS
jgi:hypothetical protein